MTTRRTPGSTPTPSTYRDSEGREFICTVTLEEYRRNRERDDVQVVRRGLGDVGWWKFDD